MDGKPRQKVHEAMSSAKWSEPGSISDNEALDKIMSIFKSEQIALLRRLADKVEVLPEKGIGSIMPVRAIRLEAIELEMRKL